jgi:hypothetical protein
MYYGDKQASKVVLMQAIALRGWKIYGFKEDKSDSMTDYYDPAYWKGIAVKNGYILVVDNSYGGTIGGSFIHKSYDAKTAKRIKKLIALRDNHAASEGEKANAQAIINQLDSKMVKEIICDTGLLEIAYQANPGNSKWHIERDGKIIAKGTGVFSFQSLEHSLDCEYYIYKNYNDNELSLINHYAENEWENHYEYILKKREDKLKLLKKLDNLLNKWTKFSTIKIGDGPSEALVEKIVKKRTLYYVPEDSETPTEYFRVGDKWRRYRGIEKGLIYKLSDDKKSCKKLTKKWKSLSDGTHIDTYKPNPNGSTKSNFHFNSEKDFKNGDLVYINLIEKEEITQEVTYIKSRRKIA